MSKHSGLGAIADGAHKLGEGMVDVTHSARSGALDAVHGAANLLHAIQRLGINDILGTVGLQRRRGFAYGVFLGGIALGASAAVIAAIAIPQAPKARRAVRNLVRSTLSKGSEIKEEVADRLHQNGKYNHEANA
ncbi:MAG: hypothetical protein U0414_16135 [Polyangiaceae bacterium]